MASPYQVPMLLTSGGYIGTLAAARCLGQRQIPLVLVDDEPSSPTAKSRYLSRHLLTNWLQGPTSKLVELGLELGRPVLYPTSDDTAWMMASEQEQLCQGFRLYQAPKQAIYRVLNKKHLYTAAATAGLAAPESWYPKSFAEVEALAPSLPYPILIKPKTQVGLKIPVKGMICTNSAELVQNWARCEEIFSYRDELLRDDPDLRWPMLQRFHTEAATDTYSVGGFIDKSGKLFVARAAQKVLQQPLRIGVGLAFASRPMDEQLLGSIKRLCLEVGYYGVFEIEFIHSEDARYLLMDFNPRFYGQMAFEIARGMPLPWFAYLRALGLDDELEKGVKAAQIWNHSLEYRFCFGLMLRLLLTTQSLAGRLSLSFRRRWLAWCKENQVIDAIMDDGDKGPYQAYKLGLLRRLLRHPRSSLRYYFG